MSNKFDNVILQREPIVSSFKCPNCSAIAAQNASVYKVKLDKLPETSIAKFKDNIVVLTCHSCSNESIWLTRKAVAIHQSTFDYLKDDERFDNHKNYEFEKILYPSTYNDAPEPDSDMPYDVLDIYKESCLVLQYSPRSSAALTRLAIEKLVNHLDAEGDNLNQKIGNLSKKGLGDDVIKMLDIVRIFGNNAVHPGIIEIEDDKSTALFLLEFTNLIVRDTISRKKRMEEFYSKIPEERRKAIEKRNAK